MTGLLLTLLRALFPPACPLCQHTLSADCSVYAFCPDCAAAVTPLPQGHCPLCALPFTAAQGSSHLCGRCLKKPPAYSKVYCCGLYQYSLRQAIHKFKFSGGVALDRTLGRMLAAAIDCGWRPDLVVPVPLEQQRLRQRGYNQALLLARELARRLGSACDQQILRKTRATAAQHELPAQTRRSNLAGVFAAGSALQEQKVLLVDDVMTTGATVDACSRTLMEAGAAEVRVVVLARSPL